MAFVRFPAAQVHWSHPPASSDAVERGFCRDCRTPLSYRQVDGPNVSLTIHSLDDPDLVVSEMSFSVEMRTSWCLRLAELPSAEM